MSNAVANYTTSTNTLAFTGNNNPGVGTNAPTPSATAGTPVYSNYNGNGTGKWYVTWTFTSLVGTFTSVSVSNFAGTISGNSLVGWISASTVPTATINMSNAVANYTTSTAARPFTGNNNSGTYTAPAPVPSLTSGLVEMQIDGRNASYTINMAQYISDATSYSVSFWPTNNIPYSVNGSILTVQTQYTQSFYQVLFTGTNSSGTSGMMQFNIYQFTQAPIMNIANTSTQANPLGNQYISYIPNGAAVFFRTPGANTNYQATFTNFMNMSYVSYDGSGNLNNAVQAYINEYPGGNPNVNILYVNNNWAVGTVYRCNVNVTNIVGTTSTTYWFKSI